MTDDEYRCSCGFTGTHAEVFDHLYDAHGQTGIAERLTTIAGGNGRD